VRIKGWMGRADQATKVRGMFVHPHQVAEVLRRHGVARGRLVVENHGGEDRMTLSVEEAGDASFVAAMEATLRDVMKLRGAVVCAAPGSLPNDGKVIEATSRRAGPRPRMASRPSPASKPSARSAARLPCRSRCPAARTDDGVPRLPRGGGRRATSPPANGSPKPLFRGPFSGPAPLRAE
jgi:hypothetical protein